MKSNPYIRNVGAFIVFISAFLIFFTAAPSVYGQGLPSEAEIAYEENASGIVTEIRAPDGTVIAPQGTAAFPYPTLVKLPGIGQTDANGRNVVMINPESVGLLLKSFFNYLIGIALVLTVVMVVYGGVIYATSDAASKTANGKKIITDAFYGLALVLSSWLILYTINPDLLNFTVDIGRVELQGTSTGGLGRAISGPSGGIPAPNSSGARCTAIPDTQLVTIRSEAARGIHRTTADTANRFYQMREAALRDNIDLKVTSGYRTEAMQVRLWNRLSGGSGNVARPCSLGGSGSNHQAGDAIDINVGCGNGARSCNTATYNWLKANGGRYGFNNALPNDPPHWSRSGR